MRWGGSDEKRENDKKDKRKRGGDSDASGSESRGQEIKQEIQQIIRDELKMIVNGEASGQRSTRVHANPRFHIKKPIKVGGQRSSDRRHERSPDDPAIRHDIELLTQVQMELSEELAENLKQLKSVIAESQALAERIQAVLGQSKNQG